MSRLVHDPAVPDEAACTLVLSSLKQFPTKRPVNGSTTNSHWRGVGVVLIQRKNLLRLRDEHTVEAE